MQFKHLFNKYFVRWFRQKRQLIHLLSLAATLTASNILAYAVAASLFLTKVGTESIPLFYLLLGLLSLPVSTAFLKIIDRYSRPQIFRYLLLVASVGVCVLFALAGLGNTFVYYALYISFSLLDLLFYILLWTLVSDYFTPIELERITANVAMAITVGGILGGSCVQLLSQMFATEKMLLVLPLLYGVAIAQLFSFQKQYPKSVSPSTEKHPRLLDSLRNFPRIASLHPIIILLFANTLLSVFIWTISELQFFNIYSKTFSDSEDLAGFLGLLSAWFSILELAVAYFFTRPLIHRWGVSRMNLVYPLTTLVSFILLALVQLRYFTFFQLPVAIIANINYDSLNNSVSDPVQNLNYNAIPHRFIGRVRVLINGLFYPACQAIAGGLLLLQQVQKSQLKLALLGIILSGIMVGIGYFTGKIYIRALLVQLRLGSVTLDEVSEGLVQLPAYYAREVRQLLSSENSQTQLLGVELASRFAEPSQFLDEIQTLLLRADEKVRQAVVKLLSSSDRPDFNRFLRTQLVSDSDAVRAVVLEALIVSGKPLSNVQLCFFLEDSNPEIRALACVAAWQAITQDLSLTIDSNKQSKNNEVKTAYAKVWQKGMDTASLLVIIRAVSRIRNRKFIPLLEKVLHFSESKNNFWLRFDAAEIATVKREGLNVLAILAKRGDESLAALAVDEVSHPDSSVRVAAFNLLGVVRNATMLELLKKGLSDRDPIVQEAAARAIAAYEESYNPKN